MPNARKFILYMADYYAKQGYREGTNNRNQFSDIVNAYGLKGYQNAPWCATYQFALELMAFGKAQALKNWHMTASNYCGYSVFETEAKFKAAGALSTTPHQNDLVIFKQSHMGRVLSVDGKNKTFKCSEGNSGDKCVVKVYKYTDSSIKSFCHINYGNDKLTMDKITGALQAAYEMAHNLKWIYSDSQTIPPCIPDKRISCDRLEALACFILGYTNQPKGGFVTSSMEKYMLSYGWKKITNPKDLRRGDFILMKKNGQTTATWEWHAFALTEYISNSNVSKYDTGSDKRIKEKQPYVKVPLNEWVGKRSFYCGFRAPYEDAIEGTYVIESAVDRNFVVDVKSASAADKANIQCYKKNGTQAQTFYIEQAGNGYYRIRNIKSKKCLDVNGGKVKNKQNIWQYPWNATNAQKWKLQKNADGSYTFVSALNRQYVMDLNGGKAKNGQNIQLYQSNGTKAQEWFLKKVG